MKSLISFFKELLIKGDAECTDNEDKKVTVNDLKEAEFTKLKSIFNKELPDRDRELYLDEVAASFRSIRAHFNEKDKRLNEIWSQYIAFSVNRIRDFPDELLGFINKHNYKSLFDFIKNWAGTEVKKKYAKEKILDSAVKLCGYILNNIDPYDIPSLMLIGKIYLHKKDYESAKKCFTTIMEQPDGFNGITSLADCYEKEINDLLKEQKTKGYNGEVSHKIRYMNRILGDLYESNIIKLADRIEDMTSENENADKEKLRYVSLVCMYARWQKKRSNYEKCMNALEAVPEDYPEYHRVLLEIGLLQQLAGSRNMPNRFHDINKAVLTLRKADQLFVNAFADGGNQYVRSGILVPLATSLYMAEKYEEAEKVCSQVLQIDPDERNVNELLKKINAVKILSA